MKALKKLISLLLVIALLCSVVSCGGGAGNGGGDDTQGGTTDTPDGGNGTPDETPDEDDKDAKTVYDSIVYADGFVDAVNYRDLIAKLQKMTGKRPKLIAADASDASGNEIIFGDTDREASSKARRALERYKSSENIGKFQFGYAIYAKGGSVALVWDHDYGADIALSKLFSLLEDPEAPLAGEYSFADKFELGCLTVDIEDKKRESIIETLEETFGIAAAQAIRDHIKLAGDEFYTWLANLYEPRHCICENYNEEGYRICLLPKDAEGNYLCYGGGFYYCNSARDTKGYYIDLESTVQAFGFLTSGGLLSSLSKIDQQIKYDVIAFVKSTQSSDDGYFYHPQWGKNIIVSRRGRDLSWATSLLSSFGGTPFYDTPSGWKGELGAPTGSSVTSHLGESVAVAASRIALAAVWPDHLKTVEAFEKYLDSFNLKEGSYSTGNTMSSQAAQFNSREKEGIESGEFTDSDGDGIAENGIKAAFERHFNEAQNPENGLWQDSVHYNSVNGLMKIGGAYSSLGLRIPNADKAFESACEMALLPAGVADIKGKQANGSVDVYNPWVALSNVMANVRKFGSPEEADAMREKLRENAAEMIRVTTEKTKKFAKPDGSYGYTWSSPPSHSQGAPVCPSGFIEGDINGGTIALTGIWSNMANALGCNFHLYGESDGVKFMYILETLKPTGKKYGD